MLLALGVLVLLGGIAMIFEQMRFIVRAKKVEAEVVEMEEIETRTSNSSGYGTRKRIVYRPTWLVVTDDGEERITSTEGSSRMNVPIGTKQQILIDPKRAGTGRPVGATNYWFGAAVIAAGAFLIVSDQLGIWK